MSPLLLLFIDGIGLGDDDPAINPFVAASLPTLRTLLDQQPIIAASAPYHGASASITALDATLGVPGLPQSGTGQTALFTGENAAAIFGRHFGPWVPTALRDMLSRQNVLTRAKEQGRRVAFANAYPEEVFTSKAHGRDPLRAGPPIAALGARVLNRHTPELMRGDAVASEIINEGWRHHLNRTDLPVITPAKAGHNLARIANQHDLTMFAHYSTDHVGHTHNLPASIAALERVDEFLGGVIAEGKELTIALVSDHGNLEDVRVGHTLNPAVGVFLGPLREELTDGVKSLTDVAPSLLQVLR